MLTVLSPAKTLDYETAPITQSSTVPRFMDQSALLVEDARGLNPDDIRSLMGVSEQIAHLNHERFMNWQAESTLTTLSKPFLPLRAMFTLACKQRRCLKRSRFCAGSTAYSLGAVRSPAPA